MEQIFKMAWGKGAYFSLAIGVIVELVLICIFFMVGAFYLGIILVALCVLMVWFQYATIKNNRYEVSGNDLIVKCFGDKKRVYPIDKIQKIVYVDCGTDWQKTPPNSRYQLAVYFDRKYIKSVEPRRFGPEDRDAFVEILFKINPNIVIEQEEINIKGNNYPFA